MKAYYIQPNTNAIAYAPSRILMLSVVEEGNVNYNPQSAFGGNSPKRRWML